MFNLCSFRIPELQGCQANHLPLELALHFTCALPTLPQAKVSQVRKYGCGHILFETG